MLFAWMKLTDNLRSHMNSVDMFPNGDVLISMRYNSALYRVSRTSGNVIWRLGGKLSDFDQAFDFSGQHNARIISTNDSVTIISVFDNASTDISQIDPTADVLSFNMVAVYENEPRKRAEVSTILYTIGFVLLMPLSQLLQPFYRSDGNQTRLRGNLCYHPSTGCAFIGWASEGDATELGADGSVLQQFRFLSDLFNSYRIYRGNFIGTPHTLPDLRSLASVNDEDEISLTSYGSWNGATEVNPRKFFALDDRHGEFVCLGWALEAGFETSFTSRGMWKYVWVRALDKDGALIVGSNPTRTEHSAALSLRRHEDELLMGAWAAFGLGKRPLLLLWVGGIRNKHRLLSRHLCWADGNWPHGCGKTSRQMSQQAGPSATSLSAHKS
jgi:hypothetical protein